MHREVLETILDIRSPWYVCGMTIDQERNRVEVSVDFTIGTRFPHPSASGLHPVHDTTEGTYRTLDLCGFQCFLKVRQPRVKLPNGQVLLVRPEWAGKLAGFTLKFEAMIVAFASAMPWLTVARLTKTSYHSVRTIINRYVDLAEAKADLSEMTMAAVDETSSKRGHNYITIVADAEKRKVVFVTEGRNSKTIEEFAEHLLCRNATPEQISNISMDMSPAFISGATSHLPNARITYDKFHVVAHASKALDETRRHEQKTNAALKGTRWILLKDRDKLNDRDRAVLDHLISNVTTHRTARAWLYREQLREILDRVQVNVVEKMLKKWCQNVLRSKVTEMHRVAHMIRKHFDGILAWTQTRQTNGFLEAINGLFQSAKRAARGYKSFQTMRAVMFLIAGDLDFHVINPHVVRK